MSKESKKKAKRKTQLTYAQWQERKDPLWDLFADFDELFGDTKPKKKKKKNVSSNK